MKREWLERGWKEAQWNSLEFRPSGLLPSRLGGFVIGNFVRRNLLLVKALLKKRYVDVTFGSEDTVLGETSNSQELTQPSKWISYPVGDPCRHFPKQTLPLPIHYIVI